MKLIFLTAIVSTTAFAGNIIDTSAKSPSENLSRTFNLLTNEKEKNQVSDFSLDNLEKFNRNGGKKNELHKFLLPRI